MKKEVVVQFDEECYNSYKQLRELIIQGKKAKKKPDYNQLFSSVNNALMNIKANPTYGDLIPRKYLTKKLVGDQVKIIALVLEFMDHTKYNKIFKYKKR